MDKYLSGETTVGPIDFNVGKDSVRYQAVERWVNIDRSHTVRCETASKISFTVVVGTAETEIDRLESVVESSVSNGLASLKSSIKSVTGREFTLTVSSQESHEFNIPAPHCGRQTYFLYQRLRDHLFVIKKHRRLRKPLVIDTSVKEYTANFEVRIESDRDDPTCPCKEKKQSNFLGEILRFTVGKLSFVASADRENADTLSLMIGAGTYTFNKTDGLYYETTLEAGGLPVMMQTLSGVREGKLTVKAMVQDEEGSGLASTS